MPKIDLRFNPQMIKIIMQDIPDRPGIAAEIFSTLSEKGINVELISSVATRKNRGDVSFAVPEQDLGNVTSMIDALKGKIGAKKAVTDASVSLISLYGEKLSADPAFSSRIFKSLAGEGINLQMISQSVSTLSFLVDRAKLEKAVAIIKSTGEIEG